MASDSWHNGCGVYSLGSHLLNREQMLWVPSSAFIWSPILCSTSVDVHFLFHHRNPNLRDTPPTTISKLLWHGY